MSTLKTPKWLFRDCIDVLWPKEYIFIIVLRFRKNYEVSLKKTNKNSYFTPRFCLIGGISNTLNTPKWLFWDDIDVLWPKDYIFFIVLTFRKNYVVSLKKTHKNRHFTPRFCIIGGISNTLNTPKWLFRDDIEVL